METLTFLNKIFHQGIPTHKLLNVYTLPDKVSGWFNTTKKAALYIERRDEASNTTETELPLQIYFGVNLVSLKEKKDGGYETPSTSERGRKNNIKFLNCLVADIDICGEGHKSGTNYPRTRQDADNIINSFPVYPTLVVDSGGGYHCYWVFDEPIPNDNFVSERWGILIMEYAKEQGFEIDNTFDPSRVLRPTRTKNKKIPHKPHIVDVINHEYNYISASVVYDLIENIKYEEKKKTTSVISITPEAFPQKKWEDMMEDERFRNAWNMTRKGKDNSPSAHEMSVVYYSYLFGLTDGEVFAVMTKFRSVHKLPMKHRSYYDTTIATAKASVERNTSVEKIEQNVEIVNQTGDESNIDKDELLNQINLATGIKFTSFVKMVMDEPAYIAYVGQKKIPLGGIGNVMSEQSFKSKVAAGIDKIMEPVGKKWNKIAQAILLCSDKVYMGNYGSDTGMMLMWVSEYLASATITKDLNDALHTGFPLESIGYYFIFGDELRRWVNTAKGESITSKKMGIDLRTIGAEPVIQNGEVDGKKTTRSMWKIPMSSIE